MGSFTFCDNLKKINFPSDFEITFLCVFSNRGNQQRQKITNRSLDVTVLLSFEMKRYLNKKSVCFFGNVVLCPFEYFFFLYFWPPLAKYFHLQKKSTFFCCKRILIFFLVTQSGEKSLVLLISWVNRKICKD